VMKAAYFANSSWYLYNFRRSLLRRARDVMDEVVLIAPEGPYIEALEDEGFRCRTCPLNRKSLNPLKEGRSLLHLVGLFRDERPDLVHNFTLKSIVYGSYAAGLTGVSRRVNAITGLGHFFSSTTGYEAVVSWGIRHLLRHAVADSEVIFQNPDDLEAVLQHGIAAREQCHLIRSSGVDVNRFSYEEPPGEPVTLIFASRMLWSKGVGDFVEAGRQVWQNGGRARFVLVGAPDDGNPDSVSEEQLRKWDREEGIEWWGFQEDMPQVLDQSHIVCLPTRYGEGVPKILTEAAATGRPLVATDVPGCREIVEHGENGLLVRPGDVESLAEAFTDLIDTPARRRRMGQRSRERAEQQFSNEKVVDETLAVYRDA